MDEMSPHAPLFFITTPKVQGHFFNLFLVQGRNLNFNFPPNFNSGQYISRQISLRRDQDQAALGQNRIAEVNQTVLVGGKASNKIEIVQHMNDSSGSALSQKGLLVENDSNFLSFQP